VVGRQVYDFLAERFVSVRAGADADPGRAGVFKLMSDPSGMRFVVPDTFPETGVRLRAWADVGPHDWQLDPLAFLTGVDPVVQRWRNTVSAQGVRLLVRPTNPSAFEAVMRPMTVACVRRKSGFFVDVDAGTLASVAFQGLAMGAGDPMLADPRFAASIILGAAVTHGVVNEHGWVDLPESKLLRHRRYWLEVTRAMGYPLTKVQLVGGGDMYWRLYGPPLAAVAALIPKTQRPIPLRTAAGRTANVLLPVQITRVGEAFRVPATEVVVDAPEGVYCLEPGEVV
jgi:hypothetical protein